NLTERDIRNLESLGYVGSQTQEAATGSAEQQRSAKEMMPVYDKLVDARHLMYGNKVEEAVLIIREVLGEVPDCTWARILLGTALLEQRRFAQAAEVLETLLKDQPDNVEAHSRLGRALGEQGLWKEALAHLRKAVEIEPDFPQHHFSLGIALNRV